MKINILEKPPLIKRINNSEQRPLWSVMIPTYNCGRFLEETLESVLRQDPGIDKMQIEVVDDCSSDDLQKLVKGIGGERIGFYRQPENCGSLKNFATCLNRSKGHLVHLLHGDDRVIDGFYNKMSILFAKYPKIGAGFSRYAYINESGERLFASELEMKADGILKNWLVRLGERQKIQAPSIVVKREVYEKLGGFYGVHYGEDWEMWLRIAANYPVGYVTDILAEYRKHHNSITGKSIRTGQNMRDLQKVMSITCEYFPVDERKRIINGAMKFYAHYAVRTANNLWNDYRDKEGVKAQIKEATKMQMDPIIFLKIMKIYTKMILNI